MTIGWYVHHHGAGHLTRMLAVRSHLDEDVVVLSSLDEPASLPARTRWVQLPRDDEGFTGPVGGVSAPPSADATVGGLLHWAPLGHAGHRSRLARLAEVARDEALAAMVVDVSVEVTLFSRLLGVPTVVFTQPGDRTDEPHRLAYRAATAIIAPWPEGVLPDAALLPVRDKVRWVGGISRADPEAARAADATGGVVLLGPQPGLDRAGLRLAARVAGLEYSELGTSAETWTDDPAPALAAARVVVSAAGQNSVADVAAAGTLVILVPQDRPFDEQAAAAEALERLGLAVVAHDAHEPASWAALIDRALALQPDWPLWQVSGAARRAADRIREVAS